MNDHYEKTNRSNHHLAVQGTALGSSLVEDNEMRVGAIALVLTGITVAALLPGPRAYILLGIALLLLAGGMRRRKSAE
jgi:hypothetical protein